MNKFSYFFFPLLMSSTGSQWLYKKLKSRYNIALLIWGSISIWNNNNNWRFLFWWKLYVNVRAFYLTEQCDTPEASGMKSFFDWKSKIMKFVCLMVVHCARTWNVDPMNLEYNVKFEVWMNGYSIVRINIMLKCFLLHDFFFPTFSPFS